MDRARFFLPCIIIISLLINIEIFGSSDISIIPKPVSVQTGKGEFRLNSDVRIFIPAPSAELTKICTIFSNEIKSMTGLELPDSNEEMSKKVILIKLTGKADIHHESYTLGISSKQVLIKASSNQGIFYGLQSLKQLILTAKKEKGEILLPVLDIYDYPRFAWRGMHLDVSRHFITPDSVKRFLDFLATYKLNRFHWHLSDHEGWRVEIIKYPRLTEVGAFMKETATSRMNDKSSEKPEWFPDGGFYTQKEIRDIVKYAAERFIEVIPEIDIPGHSYSLIASYPELGVVMNNDTIALRKEPPLILRPSEETFTFLDKLFAELLELFPSKVIHIGGDESRLDQWKASPEVQNQMATLGLRNESELHNYFVKRIEKIINSHSRRIIGWDEINDAGNLAQSSMVMAWRGLGGYENARKAAESGNEVVMSPESHCYLNFYQTDQKNEPKAYNSLLLLEKIYSYEPVPPKLENNKTKYILGVQGCLWSEYVPAFKQLEYQLFPRLTALSEIAWSSQKRDFEDYETRLQNQVTLFNAYQINFAKLPKDKKLADTDSLPDVFPGEHADLIFSHMRNEASLRFAAQQLPDNLSDWEEYKSELRKTIIEKSGLKINHTLPLDMKETNSVRMDGYSIKNIFFQTQPGIYATANLFIPEGKGPFPALIILHGHSDVGKLDYQVVGHDFAQRGYVCLAIDAWGSGERSTTSKGEYHGGNLGASCMNIGESLLGLQITDNIRGIDLLCSLPYVDTKKIGATGASGGGNMTMWLAAMDERVKAAMPIISVGTFESYVMRSNCVCELLVDGLTFTEEAGVLGMIAPRPLKICNHQKDDNPTFFPSEMLRSFANVKYVYDMYDAGNLIDYQIFDFKHGYFPADEAAAVNWFNLHLMGNRTMITADEIKFKSIPNEKLLVFPDGKRDTGVVSTESYCKLRGNELRNILLNTETLNVEQKRTELQNILRINEKSVLTKVYHYSKLQGWDRFALKTSDGKLIPLLHVDPTEKSKGYVVILNTSGKHAIQADLLKELLRRGNGIVIADLSGTGEAVSSTSIHTDERGKLHTMARAEIWLGETILGEWVKELGLICQFLTNEQHATSISFDGNKETGLAALFFAAIGVEKIDHIDLRESPVSYLFDNSDGVDFFSMGIHLPGFLKWGDVSLAAAISRTNINFINPVTMSGSKVTDYKMQEFNTEFEKLKEKCGQPGHSFFKE
jgi:N-acetyl-beta-hexosaminidase